MTALIRTSSFTGFREVASQLGGDADALLERFRIRPGLLLEEDARVPLRSLVGLLECAARELDCADFGLRMSEYQDLHVLGPVAVIARTSATAGEALAQIVRFIGYHSPGIRLDLDLSEPQTPRLLVGMGIAGLQQQRQMVELAMGVAHNTMKLLYGSHFAAHAVQLCGISPLPLARYRRHFNTVVYTGQPHNALVLRAEQFNQPIAQQDPALHRALVQYFSQVHQQGATDVVAQVERLVLRMLPIQRCRLPLIAEQLGLHERVLQRRLAEQGRRFEELVEAIRRERTEHYLAEPHMPMAQIAGLLGYSEQSVFNRACQRWFAMAPRAKRRQLLEQSTLD
ncbi:AraC family transcriptional regulator [Pseudomonas sp. UL073]|uniref:AraC family transcriptional regulator n=1 Tax=Zestomonas insulae TaxID=2809017 RepID=A0ABS2II60_9GAMM|nr:AraC family transcriptional regulator [Pseudomonas insulae]MBM7061853.1 AraC family transcriptional regulator [Pseudomonas insulae]